MSFLFSARQVGEESLRKIGAYSINDTAADPEHLRVALNWLDLNMAHLSGTTRLWWLVPDSLEIELAVDTASYDLPDVLGADAPADGMQFIVDAHLDDGAGNRTPLTMLRRDQYEELDKLSETGTPRAVYIDRLASPKLHVWPVVHTNSTNGYKVMIVTQTFSKSLASARYAGQQNGNLAHGLKASWQKWAIYETAASLGDGTIRRIEDNAIRDMRAVAAACKAELLAFENRENTGLENRTESRAF